MAGSPPIFAAAITLFIVWAAALVDVRTGRIPNALSLAGASLGALIHLHYGGLGGIAHSATGLGLGLALMLPGYLLRSTGAGDVKLMAAIGALLGAKSVLLAFIFAILTGAVIGVGYAVVAWRTKGAIGPFKRYQRMLTFLTTTGRLTYERPASNEVMGQRFAFGVPIAVGSTVAALWPLI